MKRTIVLALMLAIVPLVGCPSNQTIQNAGNAADIASAALDGFSKGEIAAYNQGLIPADDHQYIQQSLLTIGRAGKATDACIAIAQTNAGVVTCINMTLTTVNQLQADGALHLKSAKAKNDFALAMTGAQTALATINALLGGK